MRAMPYFLTDESWFEVVEDGDRRYRLTDNAPAEAVESYNAFYTDKLDFSDNEDIPQEDRDRISGFEWD